jgi:hypothetical protein
VGAVGEAAVAAAVDLVGVAVYAERDGVKCRLVEVEYGDDASTSSWYEVD